MLHDLRMQKGLLKGVWPLLEAFFSGMIQYLVYYNYIIPLYIVMSRLGGFAYFKLIIKHTS